MMPPSRASGRSRKSSRSTAPSVILPRHDSAMMLLRLGLALGFALFAALAGAAEPVFPPGSRIGLVPPPGMTASRAFQGFEDRARGAVLVVTELSAQSYGKVAEDFGEERMRAGGMELIARENIETARGPAPPVGVRRAGRRCSLARGKARTASRCANGRCSRWRRMTSRSWP